MRNQEFRVVAALAGAAGLAGSALGQFTQAAAAPTSAQRWETGFKIERFAPDGVTPVSTNFMSNLVHLNEPITYDTTVAVGRVDITYQGRVGILPNTAGTLNLGISRLGGAGSAISGSRITLVDSVAQAAGRNQGSVQRAVVPGTAAGGVPNTGVFAAFRGAFAGFTPAANGANTDAANGGLNNTATGTPVAFNSTGGRTVNFGSPDTTNDNFNGSGPPAGVATIDGTGLAGNFADYYKLSYICTPDATLEFARLINGSAQGQTGRYIFSYNGAGQASNGGNFNIATTNFVFAIPSPAAALPLGLLAAVGTRRRR
ncbi:MAG: hypothetical protein ACKVS8_02490 [Phycisphaerales bacterium]